MTPICKNLMYGVVGLSAATLLNGAENSWSMPNKILPSVVDGVQNKSLLLNGEWEFDFSPKEGWEKNGYVPEKGWQKITVPGECVMQGYGIEHDKPVVYRKSLTVPKSYKGDEVRLRFDGVYSYARLFVNGQFVRDHHGGFTRWEADITPFIKAGEPVEIKLEVTDKKDDISYASGYAHHPVGGILRNVKLYALPKNHWEDVYIQTVFDDQYKDATLKITQVPVLASDENLQVTLKDKSGKVILSEKKSISAQDSGKEVVWEFPIPQPEHWTSEVPYLYDLSITMGGDKKTQFDKKVGFRDVRVVGNEMLVNGKPVKLRGACRHDIHPTLGRVGDNEYDLKDAQLFKSSNMNFVRTSHYPPTEEFLNHCDELGLYVECETAVCFVNMWVHSPYADTCVTQDKAEYKERYLSQLEEMMKNFRSHPSVLFWSIGNESVYGTNFQDSYDQAKIWDDRSVIFSYPGTVPEDKKAFDLLSFHYPAIHGNLADRRFKSENFEHPDYPSLFDEWTHVPCYTFETLRLDPNIREFWAESMDKMWAALMKSQGGLGGAIWCYVDETFAIPEMKEGNDWWQAVNKTRGRDVSYNRVAGYGEWGIVDVWRREKPEFWATKKAYSPIRLQTKDYPEVKAGEEIRLALENRFDHTNMKDIQVEVEYKGQKSIIPSPDLAPRAQGELVIPAQDWDLKDKSDLVIRFKDDVGRILDVDALRIGNKERNLTIRKEGVTPEAIKVEENDVQLLIKGDGFVIPVDKASGLMTQIKSGNDMVVERGPYLNLYINYNQNTGAESREKSPNFIAKPEDWQKKEMTWKETPEGVRIQLSGNYKEVEVVYDILVTPYGEIQLDYDIVKGPEGWIRESGVAWEIARHHNRMAWDRESYWSYYPAGAYGEHKGQTHLYRDKVMKYGAKPNHAWEEDTANFFYFAEDMGAPTQNFMTNKARAMKEHIYSYTVGHDSRPQALNVFSSEGKFACRLSKQANEKVYLHVNQDWDYPEIAWGCFSKFVPAREKAKGKSNLNITPSK